MPLPDIYLGTEGSDAIKEENPLERQEVVETVDTQVLYQTVRVKKYARGNFKIKAKDRKGEIYQILRSELGSELDKLAWVVEPPANVTFNSSTGMQVKWNKTPAKWSLVFDMGLITEQIVDFDGVNDVAVHGLMLTGIQGVPEPYGNKTANLVVGDEESVDVTSFYVKVCDAPIPYNDYPFDGVGDQWTIYKEVTSLVMEWDIKLSDTPHVIFGESYNISVKDNIDTTTWYAIVTYLGGSTRIDTGESIGGWTITKLTDTTARIDVASSGVVGYITVYVGDGTTDLIDSAVYAPAVFVGNSDTNQHSNISELPTERSFSGSPTMYTILPVRVSETTTTQTVGEVSYVDKEYSLVVVTKTYTQKAQYYNGSSWVDTGITAEYVEVTTKNYYWSDYSGLLTEEYRIIEVSGTKMVAVSNGTYSKYVIYKGTIQEDTTKNYTWFGAGYSSISPGIEYENPSVEEDNIYYTEAYAFSLNGATLKTFSATVDYQIHYEADWYASTTYSYADGPWLGWAIAEQNDSCLSYCLYGDNVTEADGTVGSAFVGYLHGTAFAITVAEATFALYDVSYLYQTSL